MGPELYGPRPAPDPSASDELDHLLDNNGGMQDVFRELDTNMEVSAVGRDESYKGTMMGDMGLGIDEEIKVRRKRRPNPKLDEDLLLSSAGIPKLRRIVKERLRFKGKGHEFSDVARLLNMYQLWLDDLYPKAKFADGLAMIEKLGHTRRMQIMRKEWINEGKPKLSSAYQNEAEQSRTDNVPDDHGETGVRDNRRSQEDSRGTTHGLGRTVTPAPGPRDDGLDLYGASPIELGRASGASKSGSGERRTGGNTEEPEGDELDALLAEDHVMSGAQLGSLFGNGTSLGQSKLSPRDMDPFADEMEAMEGMDGMW